MIRRRLLVLLSVIATFLAVAGAASAAAGAPAEGMYDGCAGSQLDTACVQHLETMRDAGFSVVLNYTALYSTPEQVRTYMRAADRLDMKIIWSLKDPVWWQGDASDAFSSMSAACGCHTNARLLAYVVHLVKGSPATWGYYVGDETDPSQAAAANAFSAEVHRDDPHHPRLFVGVGDGVNQDIRPFASQADVLGADIYPVGEDRPLDVVSRIGAELHAIAHRGQRTAMVLQAFSWAQEESGPGWVPTGPKTWPTGSQMHEMLRDAAAAHPSLILWWSYYKVFESGAPRQHWTALRDAVFGSAPRPAARRRSEGARAALAGLVDLPAAAGRALGIADPHAAPALTLGDSLRGFVRSPDPAVQARADGRVLTAAVGCLVRCSLSIRFALVGAAGTPLGTARTLTLRAGEALALRTSVPPGAIDHDRITTMVTVTARGRTESGALYQEIHRSG